MAEESNNRGLTEFERQLIAVNERISNSLTQLELLYRGEIQKEDESRKERKEIDDAYLKDLQKQDEMRKESREAQQVYEERHKRWDERETTYNRAVFPQLLVF